MAGIGAGWLYPKVVYSFRFYNKDIKVGYNSLFKEPWRGIEISFFMHQPGNSFKYYFSIVLFTKMPYRKLHVKEFSYSFDNTKGMFLEDADFQLPARIVSVTEMSQDELEWINKGDYYWINDYSIKPLDKKKDWPKPNFGKIFKGKKLGETFPFVLRYVYNFDNEEEKVVEIKYIVKCLQGKFIPFWMGW